MNILIPHKWLLEHLETTATPKQIQRYLSLCGPTVENITKIKGDSVYDIEITSNRVDSASIRGIAREAAAILPEFGIKAKLKPLKKLLHGISQSLPPLDIKIVNDPKLCHRILALKLENVKVAPSPQWLKTRLEQINQRPLNNLIDITNYVMWDLGHPCHIFDYDLIKNKTIIVRSAKKGELATTLDNKSHLMQGGEVVFDDGSGTIIDLPGIMGTKNSIVNNNTKNALLLIDSIKAEKIRFTSMTHAIRTQAAILNEKNVDPNLGYKAILRAYDLAKKISKGQAAGKLFDTFPNRSAPKPITLKQKTLDTYLGITLPKTRVARILTSLGFKVSAAKGDSFCGYVVTPPSYRSEDVQIPQDVIEEIARIYGYHNLPSSIMATPIPDNPSTEDFQLEHLIKVWLSDWGLTETYTHSLVSRNLALQSGQKLNQHLKLKNPLTDDWVYLRRSLTPSLINVITSNQKPSISIFEMQNVYHPRPKKLPEEKLHLNIITANKSFANLKGIVICLLTKLHIANLSIKPGSSPPKTFSKNQTGIITSEKTVLGYLGKIADTDYFGAELYVKPLLKLSSRWPHYIPASNKPPIIEDLTFTLPAKTYIGPVIKAITDTSKLVEKVILKDTYGQNYTFTLSYRHPEKSLKDKEITPIRRKIITNLKKSFKAKLIGKVD